MIRRAIAAGATLGATLLLTAAPVAAHPLGNATINRATAVTIGLDQVRVVHIVDMAEIPAFAAILEMDTDGDGTTSGTEEVVWATAACAAATATLTVAIDARPLALELAAAPDVSFPPGVGGLETLRLGCTIVGGLPAGGETHVLAVADGSDDARRGWRELSIAAGTGTTLSSTNVPSVSPSALLTAYPDDLLQAPIDIVSGSATYRSDQAPASTPAPAGGEGAWASGTSSGQSDALVDLLVGGTAPWSWLLALVVAAGLGAAHALSPGHGKALIAAYVIGSRGSMRRAAGLGLTVATAHTLGIFLLGAIVLSATEFLVPDRVVAWLSVASGILVVGLGVAVARRAWRSRRRRNADPLSHTHGHAHPHPHGHEHGHTDASERTRPPAARELLTLGLVGGMVPSTSALLVLLVAIATGRMIEGLFLILAFGAGMAIVLGGLAAVTALARNGLADAATQPGATGLRRLAGTAPLVSAVVIIMVGVATTVGAIGSL